jgi:hypothetical protein
VFSTGTYPCAIGIGTAKAAIASFGAEQCDDDKIYFSWYYGVGNVGILTARNVGTIHFVAVGDVFVSFPCVNLQPLAFQKHPVSLQACSYRLNSWVFSFQVQHKIARPNSPK